MSKKLIIITGSPWVGKTTVAEKLFELYENSAFFDGDWAWCVNPFSLDDPQLPSSYKTMSFVLSNYLNQNFDYVVFSSVYVIGEKTREIILNGITAKDYKTVFFALKCSEKSLIERHRIRGDKNEVTFEWLRFPAHPGDYVIDTDNKTPEQIASEIKSIVDQFV